MENCSTNTNRDIDKISEKNGTERYFCIKFSIYFELLITKLDNNQLNMILHYVAFERKKE